MAPVAFTRACTVLLCLPVWQLAVLRLSAQAVATRSSKMSVRLGVVAATCTSNCSVKVPAAATVLLDR